MMIHHNRARSANAGDRLDALAGDDAEAQAHMDRLVRDWMASHPPRPATP